MSIVFCDIVNYCVFFVKQKTSYEMRISDWSSDVCSSDLAKDDFRIAPLQGFHYWHCKHLCNADRQAQRNLAYDSSAFSCTNILHTFDLLQHTTGSTIKLHAFIGGSHSARTAAQ